MTSQSNDVAACEIGKSHMTFSHGQNLSCTGGNVKLTLLHFPFIKNSKTKESYQAIDNSFFY
jgi:hypothetical protein